MSQLPPPAAELLHLFSTALADVRFGDVDAQSLARLVADADAAADLVHAAQVALDRARAVHQERQDNLLTQAHRALAYARVYAESDDALRERLDAIVLPRAPKKGRPEPNALVLVSDVAAPSRRRGRPRKAAIAESSTGELVATG